MIGTTDPMYQQNAQGGALMMQQPGMIAQPGYQQQGYPQQGYQQQGYPNQVSPTMNQMYGQPGVGMMPQQTPMFQQVGIVYVFQPRMTGFQKLQTVPGIFIKQKFNRMNAFLGCEQQNRYYVYGLGDDGQTKKGSKMFKCHERSECLQRQCCSPHCRAFNMDVNHKDYHDQSFDKTPFLFFERDFKCTCLCLERPELKIYSTEGGSNRVYLGKTINPWKCCDLVANVYDNSDLIKYTIVGSVCQCGVLCEGPFCQEASFDIKAADGQTVGTLKRVKASILQNCFTTTCNFAVTFPTAATAAERALFIAATIQIDFAYFEKKPNKQAGTI